MMMTGSQKRRCLGSVREGDLFISYLAAKYVHIRHRRRRFLCRYHIGLVDRE